MFPSTLSLSQEEVGVTVAQQSVSTLSRRSFLQETAVLFPLLVFTAYEAVSKMDYQSAGHMAPLLAIGSTSRKR